MAFKIESHYCKTCNQQRAFERPKPNHILHLLLSIVTLGLWLIVWVFVVVSPKAARCTVCGSKSSTFARAPQSAAPAGTYGGPDTRRPSGDLWLTIVGESFEAATNGSMFPGEVGFKEIGGMLIRNPANPHDSNAVEVHGDVVGKLGHLSREDAAQYATAIDGLGGNLSVKIRLAREDSARLWALTVVTDQLPR